MREQRATLTLTPFLSERERESVRFPLPGRGGEGRVRGRARVREQGALEAGRRKALTT